MRVRIGFAFSILLLLTSGPAYVQLTPNADTYATCAASTTNYCAKTRSMSKARRPPHPVNLSGIRILPASFRRFCSARSEKCRRFCDGRDFKLGEQAGLTVEELIRLLDAGLSVGTS